MHKKLNCTGIRNLGSCQSLQVVIYRVHISDIIRRDISSRYYTRLQFGHMVIFGCPVFFYSALQVRPNGPVKADSDTLLDLQH